MTRLNVAQADRLFACPVDGMSKQLIYLALGRVALLCYSSQLIPPRQLATNFGDTLASELGILSPIRPRYILTAKSAPPGTNGAISLLGLIMSAVGGGIMGLFMVVTLVIERETCRGGMQWAGEMLIFGIGAGFFGSLVSAWRV